VHPKRLWEDVLLTPRTSKRLQVILSTVQEGQGSGDEPYSHDSDEECVVVLEGRLEFWVGEEHYLMEEGGQSAVSRAGLPHRNVNPGPGQAKVLWVITPALVTSARGDGELRFAHVFVVTGRHHLTARIREASNDLWQNARVNRCLSRPRDDLQDLVGIEVKLLRADAADGQTCLPDREGARRRWKPASRSGNTTYAGTPSA
jgi:quercetin dioxygenase-like cupin family protein